MRYAKSMYLGGELLKAEECDYASSRELGLICPICNEAVFLVAGSVRENILRNSKKKTQILPAHFNHYKMNDDNFSLSCDYRALSNQQRLELKSNYTKSKKQRLEIFNRHLWDIIKKERNLRPKKMFKESLIPVSNTEINKLKTTVLTLWREFYLSEEYLEAYQQVCKDYFTSEGVIPESIISHSAYPLQKQYFCKHFLKAQHEKIIQEIFEFLGTNTAKPIWVNLFRMVTYYQLTFLKTVPQKSKITTTQLAYVLSKPEIIFSILMTVIYGCRWVDIIKEKVS